MLPSPSGLLSLGVKFQECERTMLSPKHGASDKPPARLGYDVHQVSLPDRPAPWTTSHPGTGKNTTGESRPGGCCARRANSGLYSPMSWDTRRADTIPSGHPWEPEGPCSTDSNISNTQEASSDAGRSWRAARIRRCSPGGDNRRWVPRRVHR